MKQIVLGVFFVVFTVLVWRWFRQDDHAQQAMENVADDVALTALEKSLPETEATSQHLVIRKAMLERREKDNREWTAANINAHPDLYLAHCGKMLAQFHDQYANSIFTVKVLMKRHEQAIADVKKETSSLMEALKESKRILSDKEHAYPVKIGTYTYLSAKNVESFVRSADKRLTELQEEVDSKSSQVEQLQNTLNELVKGRDVVRKELGDIDRKREQVNVKNMQKAVEGLQSRMNAVLSGVSVVAGDDDTHSEAVDSSKDGDRVEDIFTKRGIK